MFLAIYFICMSKPNNDTIESKVNLFQDNGKSCWFSYRNYRIFLISSSVLGIQTEISVVL